MDAGTTPSPTSALGLVRPYLTGFYDKGFVLVAQRQASNSVRPQAERDDPTALHGLLPFGRHLDGQLRPGATRLQPELLLLNRNWFSFTGFAFSPWLQFNATVFTTSTTNVTVFQGFITYSFSQALALGSGYYKVPGTREWIDRPATPWARTGPWRTPSSGLRSAPASGPPASPWTASSTTPGYSTTSIPPPTARTG